MRKLKCIVRVALTSGVYWTVLKQQDKRYNTVESAISGKLIAHSVVPTKAFTGQTKRATGPVILIWYSRIYQCIVIIEHKITDYNIPVN